MQANVKGTGANIQKIVDFKPLFLFKNYCFPIVFSVSMQYLSKMLKKNNTFKFHINRNNIILRIYFSAVSLGDGSGRNSDSQFT